MPFVYLVRRRKKREEALVQQVPDALDMIVRALRVGQSVDGALKEVGRVFAPPIGIEIRTIYEEMAMGLPFEKALDNFERRFPHVTDVKILCTAFTIQRETGGNLTRILQGLSTTIRERFTLKRQVRTLTAEGRTSAKILGILPLVFGGIVWILNSDYIRQLFVHPAGRKMLLYAAVSAILGFIFMRLMTKIEV
jgi:tight adherence protein B